MGRKRSLEKETILPENLDLTTWPDVLVNHRDKKVRDSFFRRKQAIELYVRDNASLKKIQEVTGVWPTELYRYLKSCIEPQSGGGVLGWAGILPYRRKKKYQRKTYNATNEENHNGYFQLLLDTHSVLADTIKRAYLGDNKGLRPAAKPKFVHKKFIEGCRQVGILITEYPFTIQDLAKRSLERYLKKLDALYFDEAADRHGENAARRAKKVGQGVKGCEIIEPFAAVEMDGHKIDGFFTILIKTPSGDWVKRVIRRIWLLVILDRGTRAVLGYSIALAREYSQADVLSCIRNAIRPHFRRQLSIPGLEYPANGGFPSLSIPETEWAAWDLICCDNAWANLAGAVMDTLGRIVGCTINPGPVATPERRGIIERFFGLFEENGFHRLPNTTGSNPQDPRRRDPEKKALKYEMTIDHLEDIAELVLAEYNNTPHSALFNLSPMEAMEQRVNRYDVRQIPENKRGEVSMITIHAKCTVRGSVARGRRPYIQYLDAVYRSEVLAQSPYLIGQEIAVQVNMEDLRVIKAFLADGSELGYLTAQGGWGMSPHSLRTRKEIMKLRYNKIIHFTSHQDPVTVYQDFLVSKNDKTNSTKIARIAKEQTLPVPAKIQPPESALVSEVIEGSAPRSAQNPPTVRIEIPNIARRLTRTLTY